MRTSVVVAALFALVATTVVGASDWEATTKNADRKVVRLEMGVGDSKGVCSAVVVAIVDGEADALTAAHCVAHEPTSHLDLTANGRDAQVLAFNRLLDLALIRFHAKHEEAMPLAPETPKMGAEVAVLGYAFGVKKLAAQFGRVAQPYNDETEALWLNVDLIFGDSGGAVVDDQGRLIGINSRIYSGGLFGQSAHIAAAVPIESASDFIDAYRKHAKKK